MLKHIFFYITCSIIFTKKFYSQSFLSDHSINHMKLYLLDHLDKITTKFLLT